MPVNPDKLALVDYFDKGGAFMWALLLCSLIGLAVIIYKLFSLWIASRGTGPLVEQVTRLAEDGSADRALAACEESTTSVAGVMASVLRSSHASLWMLRESAQLEGARQLAQLESGLPVLSTIAGVAPLIGFLGTVSGMIRAFTAIAEQGLGEPGIVAGGIGEALITTASGLIVAIPCYIAYSYFVARVNNLGLSMELAATHLVNQIATQSAQTEEPSAAVAVEGE